MSFSPRPSPFRRPESPVGRSPSTVRAATPTLTSPTKMQSSPMLSPERQSPFVRRPSQLTSDRPKSPFMRPASRLSVADTPEPETHPDSDPFVSASSTPDLSDQPTQTIRAPPTFAQRTSPPLPKPAPSVRPPVQRTVTSSTSATIRAAPAAQPISRPAFTAISGYNHISQPLLRSMRESFEVLDSNNHGSLTSADLSAMLEQLGLDNSNSAMSGFFPPNQPPTLNLARFLDTLAGPMAELSQTEELMAAFGAFDVDDSGQIDMGELRDALLHTGGSKMSERDMDGVLREFAGRRAFGGKGVLGKDLTGGTRGEVFRYRDFMASVSGTGTSGGEAAAVA